MKKAKSRASTKNSAEQVYLEIRERIVRGDLAPGARIVEREIAERLGVSRTPVREAVRRLTQDGFVRENPGAAYARPVVAELTSADAGELHDIVAGLESAAARRAAALPLPDREKLAGRLQDRNRDLEQAGENPETEIGELVRLDHAFHAEYLEVVAGTRLIALRRSVKPQLERYARHYTRALADELPRALEEHRAIIEAILDGDEDRAEAAVVDNWRQAAERLQKVIRSAGEIGNW